MTLPTLLTDLTSGDDPRAEQAASQLPTHGEQALNALQALLHAPQPDTRWWAVRALAEFSSTTALTESLTLALRDDSSEVRQAAALALTHRPAAEASAPLAQALTDPDRMTAQLAANALIALGPDAVPVLLETLTGNNSAARIEACRALAEIGDQRAIPALMQAMQSDSAILHYWAEFGLEKLGLNMIFMKPE